MLKPKSSISDSVTAAVTAGAPAARLGWSLCLGRQHRFTEARAALEGLIAARPDAIEAPLALGRLALIEGDPDAAQSAFAAVLARWLRAGLRPARGRLPVSSA